MAKVAAVKVVVGEAEALAELKAEEPRAEVELELGAAGPRVAVPRVEGLKVAGLKVVPRVEALRAAGVKAAAGVVVVKVVRVAAVVLGVLKAVLAQAVETLRAAPRQLAMLQPGQQQQEGARKARRVHQKAAARAVTGEARLALG